MVDPTEERFQFTDLPERAGTYRPEAWQKAAMHTGAAAVAEQTQPTGKYIQVPGTSVFVHSSFVPDVPTLHPTVFMQSYVDVAESHWYGNGHAVME